MKGFKNICFYILLSFFWLSIDLLAKSTSIPGKARENTPFSQKPEVIELKSKLEQMITKNYKDRISTQIDTNNFNVSVQVSLAHLPPLESKSHGDKQTEETFVPPLAVSDIPADTNLGNIKLNTIFEKLKNENKNNENGKKVLSEFFLESWMTQLQITEVRIFVGLDEDLEVNYKKEFGKWIQKVVRSEFGAVGHSQIFNLYRVKKVEPSKEPQTVFEQLSHYQVTIGLIFLSLILLMVTLVFRFTISKDTKEQNSTALKIQEMKAAQMEALQKINKSQIAEAKSKKNLSKSEGDESIAINIQVIAQAFRDLQFKLGYFLETNPFLQQEIAESWFAQGWQGRIKFASLIDSILTYRSLNKNDYNDLKRISSPNNTAEQILSWFHSEKKSLDSEQFEAFQEFPNIPIQDRYQILEQAYWDLLSMKLMGSQVLKTHFSVLQDLSSQQIQEILGKQDPKLKAMAVLHLPQIKIQKLFSSLEIKERQKLLDETLKLETVSARELELADEALKTVVQKNQRLSTTNDISLKLLIPNLLSSLSVQDEFKILPNAISKLPDGGLELKKSFPSLAFFPEWPEDSLRVFFDQLEVKYIITYLMIAPQQQNLILKLLPPKSAAIITDELKSGKILSDEELNQNLLFLKSRLYKLVDDETISLIKIFGNQGSINKVKAAS